MENLKQYQKCATQTQIKILVPLEPRPLDFGPSPSMAHLPLDFYDVWAGSGVIWR